jgi:8-amino-7-oxononanoate synthase
MSDPLSDLISRELSRRRDADLLRQRRICRPIDSTHVRDQDGRVLTVFASNDYLGLTHHPKVIAAARGAMETHGVGSGAAGLIIGYTDLHVEAEEKIARWKGTEAAVLLPSGYQANLAAVQTLSGVAAASQRSVRFLLDKLVHASLIDAVRASGLPYRVFPHNHMGKLARLLAERDEGQLQVVVTESIFSMDGDAADLEGLAALKRERPFTLLLDEAHATGVYGEQGRGLAFERGLQSIVDVSVITLSKALGCAGGAVCGTRGFADALLNFGRAYIYSTSVPAAIAAAVGAAIDVLRDEPERQRRVRELAGQVRGELARLGNVVPPGGGDSPIIPILYSIERAAHDASEHLLANGVLVPAVRPPTVPPGTSRLRVTLSADHSDDEVQLLLNSLPA